MGRGAVSNTPLVRRPPTSQPVRMVLQAPCRDPAPDRTGGEAIGEALDVRLYPRTPDVVIVWVAGTVDGRSVQMLALRVRQQLLRAAHVIVDLSAAQVSPSSHLLVGDVLHVLAQQSEHVHTHLHIAGIAQEHFEQQLRHRGLNHLHEGPSAAVIATLTPPPPSRRPLVPAPRTRSPGMPWRHRRRGFAMPARPSHPIEEAPPSLPN